MESEPRVDPLAGTVLPVLLHDLGNATQLLRGLASLLATPGGEALFAARQERLAEAAGRIEDLGWALAVLGSAGGAELVMDRREPRGIEILLGLARHAARRRGGDLHLPEALPRLSSRAGWELPWAIAVLALAAQADAEAREATLELEEAGGARAFSAPAGEAVAEVLPLVRARLAGAELVVAEGRWTLLVPSGWLVV